jgi:lysophospholipase L1-like esterase
MTMYQRLSLSQRPRILLLGDSITEQAWDAGSAPPPSSSSSAEGGAACGTGVGGGWAAQLAHWYRRKADIVNRGFSGEIKFLVVPFGA